MDIQHLEEIWLFRQLLPTMERLILLQELEEMLFIIVEL